MRVVWSLSGDLGTLPIVLACLFAAVGVVLLGFEYVRHPADRKGKRGLLLTGLLGTSLLLLAVLRPVRISSKGTSVGPRVVALVDVSRSMDLPAPGGTRRGVATKVVAALRDRPDDARVAVYGFGAGPPKPLAPDGAAAAGALADPPARRSDLEAALAGLASTPDEAPSAIVVVTDGRLDRPAAGRVEGDVRGALGHLEVPVHTVVVAERSPVDASVRRVLLSGAAVAHQAFSLRVEVGCEGLPCDDVPVVARELRDQGEPALLFEGHAKVVDGQALVELPVTLDRAGTRILEVAITAPAGDTIPENDRRFVAVDVGRDRIRVLHVAGRPTYDVRALRMWLKADASVDVVAFFILRTPSDDVRAPQDELALIPFPVDELFERHLPSFDAVVLQDFDADPYGLEKHLPRLAKYVEKGGGLVMVGGPDAFGPGGYGGTPLGDVLPVDLGRSRDEYGVDISSFVPRFTDVGRTAPVLGPLRALIGDDLPEMPGTNVVGDVKPGATALLVHPFRTTKTGAPMPVLAVGEVGSGRTVALTIDGSHRLLFSAFAAHAAGRAHGAFWDALLGWLMRDPRFEPAVVDGLEGCFAGLPTAVTLRPLPGVTGEATLRVERLGGGEKVAEAQIRFEDANPRPWVLPPLAPGAYGVTVEFAAAAGAAKGPSTRRDFACEAGGDEWADSRVDRDRLRLVAAATGGVLVDADDVSSLPLPRESLVATERHVASLAPPWAWTAGAALLLGAHWVLRRRAGLG